MMKYEPRGLKQSSGLSLKELGFQDRDMNRKSIGSVVLPIPGGIRDNQQVSWSSDNMTALQLAASDIALSTITGGGQGFADSTGNAVDRAGANISSIKEALAANIAGVATIAAPVAIAGAGIGMLGSDQRYSDYSVPVHYEGPPSVLRWYEPQVGLKTVM